MNFEGGEGPAQAENMTRSGFGQSLAISDHRSAPHIFALGRLGRSPTFNSEFVPKTCSACCVGHIRSVVGVGIASIVRERISCPQEWDPAGFS